MIAQFCIAARLLKFDAVFYCLFKKVATQLPALAK